MTLDLPKRLSIMRADRFVRACGGRVKLFRTESEREERRRGRGCGFVVERFRYKFAVLVLIRSQGECRN